MPLNKKSAIVRLGCLVVFLGALLLLALNRQLLHDLVLAYGVELSPEIAAMEKRIGLKQDYRLLLRASRPQLQDKQNFNQNCPRREATAYILGCYSQQQIFIYKIDDAELDGISEVTLAHEFLHAVYQRLSASERQTLDALLEANYQALKTDELVARMAMYDRTQAGSFFNELHSILGTEFADLSEELEAYYRKFFDDRRAIVALNQQSRQVFIDKEALIKELETQINNLKAAFESEKLLYEQAVADLNLTVEKFNQRAQTGGFTSEMQFQQERATLLQRQARLEQQRQALEKQIEQINQLVEKYNQTALALQKLNAELDSLAEAIDVKEN